jgi:threonine/homoserine/homoserine lactone efflux protein
LPSLGPCKDLIGAREPRGIATIETLCCTHLTHFPSCCARATSRAMTIATLAAFAASLLVLFLTPGPGVVAMVGRTLSGGVWSGASYGFGILTGDIIWLTVAITGLAATSTLVAAAGPWIWLVKIGGAAILLWFAWGALQGVLKPRDTSPVSLAMPSKRGLAATYAAGIAMPLSNPKAIAFYLSFVPAFFDLSRVGPAEYVQMIAILIAMGIVFIALYVGGAHKARDWLAAKGLKRWADGITAALLAGVAVVLLVR